MTKDGFWAQEHHEFSRGVSEKIQGIYFFHKKVYENSMVWKSRRKGWFRSAQPCLHLQEGSSFSPPMSTNWSPARQKGFSQFRRLATFREESNREISSFKFIQNRRDVTSFREIISRKDIISRRKFLSRGDITGTPATYPAAGDSPAQQEWMSVGEGSMSRIALVGEDKEDSVIPETEESLDLKIQTLLNRISEKTFSVTDSLIEEKTLLTRVSTKIEMLQDQCLKMIQKSKTKVLKSGSNKEKSGDEIKADVEMPKTTIPEESPDFRKPAPTYLTDKILLFEEPNLGIPDKFLSATQITPCSAEGSTPIGKLSSVTQSCQKEAKSGNWIVLCDGSPIMLSSTPNSNKNALIWQRIGRNALQKQHKSLRPDSRTDTFPPLHERPTDQQPDAEQSPAESHN